VPSAFFAIDDATVRPAQVSMCVGLPVRVDAHMASAQGDRRQVVDAIGLAVAELLPPQYRGAYEDDRGFPETRSALDSSRHAGL
jgi:hypothetical protein